MAYDTRLADRVREYLVNCPQFMIAEKEMFRGMTFMVNNKMCVSISGENLMCRFNPDLHQEIAHRIGYQPMYIKGKELKGYCYVSPDGFSSKKDFEYWVQLCLDYNSKAKASKKARL